MSEQNFTIRFFRDKKLLGFQSEQVGHPVYDDADYIEISIPGDMSNQLVREVTENDIQKYRAAYDAYKAGLEPSTEGTPLEAWPRLTPAQVANYKALKFVTVEQIANMSDTACTKVGMGAMADRTAANAYLKLAQDSALAQKQALEIERNENRIAELEAQIKELAAKLEEPKRGRPAKE